MSNTIKIKTKYHSSEGIITVLSKHPYENEFGKTSKYLYLKPNGTTVDYFIYNSTFANSLKEV